MLGIKCNQKFPVLIWLKLLISVIEPTVMYHRQTNPNSDQWCFVKASCRSTWQWPTMSAEHFLINIQRQKAFRVNGNSCWENSCKWSSEPTTEHFFIVEIMKKKTIRIKQRQFCSWRTVCLKGNWKGCHLTYFIDKRNKVKSTITVSGAENPAVQ